MKDGGGFLPSSPFFYSLHCWRCILCSRTPQKRLPRRLYLLVSLRATWVEGWCSAFIFVYINVLLIRLKCTVALWTGHLNYKHFCIFLVFRIIQALCITKRICILTVHIAHPFIYTKGALWISLKKSFGCIEFFHLSLHIL